MSLESGEFMTIFLSVMTVLSLTANGVLIWYIRKLLTAQDEISIELSENIYAFQDELQILLNTDVLAGEPTLVKLLDDVREFGEKTEEIRLRLIPNQQDGEADV